MPQQKNWNKRNDRRWVNRRGENVDIANVLRIVDRRDRVNTDHNWAVVLEEQHEGGTKRRTLKTFDKVKPAERWASRWRERNPEG